MGEKMNIAVVFGGISYEHEISIVSAIALKDVLTYECTFIYVDKEHRFYLIDAKDMRGEYFTKGGYKKAPMLSLTNGGFVKSSFLGEKKVEFDLALNLIHGADGEDGTIAALFDFYDVRYIGPRVEGSVLSFSKLLTKHLASQVGVDTLPYELISKDNTDVKMPYPYIVKPLNLGSSLGISVVETAAQKEYALDCAFEYDKYALIEPFHKNIKEYNLAGCKANDGFIFSIIEEPTKKDLLSFDEKYLSFSRTDTIKEAKIDESIKQLMQEAFKKIYDPYFLGALIRCDFFVMDGRVYLNEINPNPGSLANYLFEDFNQTIKELSENLPKKHSIKVELNYLNTIKKAKG